MTLGKNIQSGAQTEYGYNALNMRIKNILTYPGTEMPHIKETTYLSDYLGRTNNDLLACEKGGDTTRAVYGSGYGRLSRRTAAGQVYEMPDLWGSPAFMADAQGNAAWQAHDLWGRPKMAGAADVSVEGCTGPVGDAALRFTNYSYDPVIGKYFAQARFYDSAQGRMMSTDPVKRGLNAYRYCDNDPVNYVDPTGEIPGILMGAGIGGVFGGLSGFVGSAVSQVISGEDFSMRKALGGMANGAAVGTVKGAMLGSGAGIAAMFVGDFLAGTAGSTLEQMLTGGRVDVGESILGGVNNAVSQLLYGNTPLKGVGDAFKRGGLTGAATAGINNIAGALGIGGTGEENFPGRRRTQQTAERYDA